MFYLFLSFVTKKNERAIGESILVFFGISIDGFVDSLLFPDVIDVNLSVDGCDADGVDSDDNGCCDSAGVGVVSSVEADCCVDNDGFGGVGGGVGVELTTVIGCDIDAIEDCWFIE